MQTFVHRFNDCQSQQFYFSTFLLIGLTAFASASVSAQTLTSASAINQKPSDYQVTFDIHAMAHSPTQPIHSFVDDWDVALKKGDYAFVQGRSELRYQPLDANRMHYGISTRYDYLLRFSPASAKVYHAYKNQQHLEPNRHYPLSITAQHNHRFGFNIGKVWQVNDKLTLTPQLNVWKGVRAIDGQFGGDIHTVNDTSRNKPVQDDIDTAAAAISYAYDTPALKEQNIGWQPKKPTGYGYSLDVDIDAKLSNQTQLTIQAHDLAGKMYWQDMPMTEYQLNYGVLRRPPYSLEGKLTQQDHAQTIPWQVDIQLVHQITPAVSAGIHSSYNDYSNLHQLNVSKRWQWRDKTVIISGIAEPQTYAYGVAIHAKDIFIKDSMGIKWLTDDLDTNDAKRGDVHLYYQSDW